MIGDGAMKEDENKPTFDMPVLDPQAVSALMATHANAQAALENAMGLDGNLPGLPAFENLH